MHRFVPCHHCDLSTDRRGVTALEYGLLAGIIAVTLIGILTGFEGGIKTVFSNVDLSISAVGSNTGPTSGG